MKMKKKRPILYNFGEGRENGGLVLGESNFFYYIIIIFFKKKLITVSYIIYIYLPAIYVATYTYINKINRK